MKGINFLVGPRSKVENAVKSKDSGKISTHMVGIRERIKIQSDGIDPVSLKKNVVGQVHNLKHFLGDVITFDIDLASKNVPAPITTYEVAITTNTVWEVINTSDFVSITPTQGRGSATLTITVDKNESEDRVAEVIIGTEVHTITQDEPFFDVEFAEDVTGGVEYDQDTVNISISTNTDWTASTEEDWIHLEETEGVGSDTLAVTLDPNEGYKSRDGDIDVNEDTLTLTQHSQYGPERKKVVIPDKQGLPCMIISTSVDNLFVSFIVDGSSVSVTEPASGSIRKLATDSYTSCSYVYLKSTGNPTLDTFVSTINALEGILTLTLVDGYDGTLTANNTILLGPGLKYPVNVSIPGFAWGGITSDYTYDSANQITLPDQELYV